MPTKPKCGVLLTNTGTPYQPTAKAIKRFLGRFLMDKRIAPINRGFWWLLLHLHILPLRAKRNVSKYEAIWTEEGSPFTVGVERLVRGLQSAFNSGDSAAEVMVTSGMLYSDPDVMSAMRKMKEAGCDSLVVLPLYPQSAYSTTGAVYDAVERAKRKLKWEAPLTFIDNYHDNTTYTRAIAASVKHAGFDVDSNDRLVFSFHSIPIKDIEAGDTYELQTGASCLQIASELGIERRRWTIGYQCRFDRSREWLTPFTKDTMDRWAEAGGGRVFYICPGFSIDCLETLYDVGHEMEPYYREACERSGNSCSDDGFVYVPCLDRSKAHVKVLKDVLDPYVEECSS